MEIGVSTGFFHNQSIFDALEAIKESGIEYIELWTYSRILDTTKHFDPSDPVQVGLLKKKIDETGLKPVSIHAPFCAEIDISYRDEKIRQESVNIAVLCAGALSKVSGGHEHVKTLVVHPSSVPLKHEESNIRMEQARKSVMEIVERIKPMNVKLALENQLPHIFGHKPETLLALVNGIAPEDAGFCFDVSHASMHRNTSIEAYFDKFLDKVLALHVSDSDFLHDNHFSFGEGKILWQNFFDKLKASGFSGIFMNETLLEIPGKNKTETLKSIKERELKFL